MNIPHYHFQDKDNHHLLKQKFISHFEIIIINILFYFDHIFILASPFHHHSYHPFSQQFSHINVFKLVRGHAPWVLQALFMALVPLSSSSLIFLQEGVALGLSNYTCSPYSQNNTWQKIIWLTHRSPAENKRESYSFV